jgi:subtilisin family serine protease
MFNATVSTVPVAGGQARSAGDRGVAQQVQQLRAQPDVLLVMPNLPLTRLELPNFENLPVQWAVRNDANPAQDTRWHKVADRVGGLKPVLVGVVDSGIYPEDARLKPALWTNPKEIPGNGSDDDGNGLADDVHGWNFFENSSRLFYPKYENMNHGAFCASIIAARLTGGRNDILGLAPNATIITAVNGGQGPAINVLSAVQGIVYCAANGAKVINCSFGGPAPQEVIDQVSNEPIFKALEEAGVLLVIAAGNEFNNNDTGPRFPANLKRSNVISVAASDPAGKLGRAPAGPKKWQPYSNYGARTVHIAAPGSLILGIHEQDRAQLSFGTSFAAPQVTGAAALIWGQHPEWDAAMVRRAILETARKNPELSGKCVTGGELDIEAALHFKP